MSTVLKEDAADTRFGVAKELVADSSAGLAWPFFGADTAKWLG